MKTIKTAVSLCAVFIFMLTLCSCKKQKTYTPVEISDAILKSGSFNDMSSLSNDKLSAYFQFKDTDVKRFSVYIASAEAQADTVAVFEFEDDEKRDLVISGVSQYVTKLLSSFKSISENEYNTVSHRIFSEVGNCIVLVISENTEAPEQILNDMGAKALY